MEYKGKLTEERVDGFVRSVSVYSGTADFGTTSVKASADLTTFNNGDPMTLVIHSK